jgi:hypothetical protein
MDVILTIGSDREERSHAYDLSCMQAHASRSVPAPLRIDRLVLTKTTADEVDDIDRRSSERPGDGAWRGPSRSLAAKHASILAVRPECVDADEAEAHELRMQTLAFPCDQ